MDRPPALRLTSAGALEVTVALGEASRVEERLAHALATVRAHSAREVVARLGRDEGYRIEDVREVTVAGLAEDDQPRALGWLGRRLPPAARIVFTTSPLSSASSASSAPSAPSAATLAARIEARAPEKARTYAVDQGGRVAVESVELHVVEHCNLRCAQCCNVSPYLDEHVMTAADVREACDRLRAVMKPEVLKIMGGEPLLHPDLAGVLRAVRESRVAPRVRLFTNGLLLRSVPDETFALLDELTVSSYASAPVRPEILAETAERAARLDVVLNVKEVASFTTVLTTDEVGDAAMQATYDACWLRHRCLVVRGGTFYKCTRAAYQREFDARVLGAADGTRDASHDTPLGISLDATHLAPRIARYLSSPEPLASCRRCLGSSGPLGPHVQLRRRDVAEGRLAPQVAAPVVEPGA